MSQVRSKTQTTSGTSSRSGEGTGSTGPDSSASAMEKELPKYKEVRAGAFTGPDQATRELAAFLNWMMSTLNFYHTRCVQNELSPLQSTVRAQANVEKKLMEVLKQTPGGFLNIGNQGRSGAPSHSHPLSKRAACYRLAAIHKSLQCLISWGKSTVLFLNRLLKEKDKPHAARVAKLGLAPILLRMYDYVEGIGYVWNYPRHPRSILEDIPCPGVPAEHPVKTKAAPSTKGQGTGSSTKGVKGSSSRRSSSSQSQRPSSRSRNKKASSTQKTKKPSSTRKAAGRDSLLDTPMSHLRGSEGESGGSGLDYEEGEEMEDAEVLDLDKTALESEEKEREKEIKYIRLVEYKLTFHRYMVGWLVHEFAEVMRLLGGAFPSDSGYNIPASRKEVTALGLRLPKNYSHDAGFPSPLPPTLASRKAIRNPPF